MQTKQSTQLTKKEIHSLKTAKYNENLDKFENTYIIKNKQTGMIVEMKAASPVHACTMIGWRVRSCQLIDTIKKEVPTINTEENVDIVEKK